MVSSNFFKKAYTELPKPGEPEYFFMPKLYDGGMQFETTTELKVVDRTNDDELLRNEADEIIKKARADALRILAEAKKKAQTVINQAISDSEEICSEKYKIASENGYKEGQDRGNKTAQNEVKKALNELQILSASLSNEKKKIAEESQNLIINLAAEIAQKVTGEFFVRDEKVFLSMFNRAVKEMPAAEKLKVTVSAKDYKIMSFDPYKLLEMTKNFRSIEICCDKSAQEGTLRLESAIMLLDAGINAQIGMLKKEIVKSF